MSSSAFTQRRLSEEMACQWGAAGKTRDAFADTQTKLEDECESNMSEKTRSLCDTRPYSTGADSAYALHTLVDMALALEESSGRRTTDHTYALKDISRNHPTEDTDKVSSEKDHTYASNTIGFRYSNHRSVHAQPRKSASEENLVFKTPPTTESSARKCTSTEEFIIPDQPLPPSGWTDQSLPSLGLNATLPRSKVKSYMPMYRDFCCQDHAHSSTTAVLKSSPKNLTCDNIENDSVMEVPMKCDHTYAKFGANAESGSPTKTDPAVSPNTLSSSAPGKLDRGGFDRIAHSGPSDHTYDKLSSAKRKDLYKGHTSFKSGQALGNSQGCEQQGAGIKTEHRVHPNAESSACVIAMDWQSQDHGQMFEKRFLPMDHTYTTVA